MCITSSDLATWGPISVQEMCQDPILPIFQAKQRLVNSLEAHCVFRDMRVQFQLNWLHAVANGHVANRGHNGEQRDQEGQHDD